MKAGTVTWVRELGTMLVVVGSVVASLLWMSSRMSELRDQLIDVNYRLGSIERSIGADRNWTKRDMQSWTEILRARNPELDAPEVR